MDLGAVVVAIAGVAATLGGALLTQRGADRAKQRELELSRAIEEAREDRALRRSSYTELHRDARQFATALSRHLYVLRDRAAGDEDTQARAEWHEGAGRHALRRRTAGAKASSRTLLSGLGSC